MKLAITCLALGICSAVVFHTVTYAQTTGQIASGNAKSCAAVCQQTAEYCNTKKGKYGQESLMNTIKDCITTCKSVSELLGRGSGLAIKAVPVCVEACNECAKACDQFKADKQLTECANECRKTASNMEKIK